MIPKFNNVPNNRIQVKLTTPAGIEDVDYWISRSVAVVGVVVAITDDGIRILITKRSKNMRDEKQKLCLPCGFLDWSESAHDAMIREVYEETSLYLPDHKEQLLYNNNEEPFKVIHIPTESKRQNVSLLFLSVYDFSKHMDKFPYEIEEFHCHETESVKWWKLIDFYQTHKDYQWAFNHDQIIKDAMIFFNIFYKF